MPAQGVLPSHSGERTPQPDMEIILDLGARPLLVPTKDLGQAYEWETFAHLWNSNDLRGAHDWLNGHWSALIDKRVAGEADPEARFLQALGFATIALCFTQENNQEGALLMLDDALIGLAPYRPAYLGVHVDPIVATLQELRPVIAALAPDGECPLWPFVYCRFEFRR